MRALVLAYHSHHVLSARYAENDHVALAADLATLTRCGARIVGLRTLVRALVHPLAARLHRALRRGPLVALTFDDGPAYDHAPFVHPQAGPQPGFLPVLAAFRAGPLGARQPSLHATSFVIASPEARRVIERSFDPTVTYLGPGALRDDWWNDAIDSGLLDIANHSFDHLHPALAAVAHSQGARGDFAQVATAADAEAQIGRAQRLLLERTRGRAAPFFAFPFGHTNAFLVHGFLPAQGARLGLRAAFTTAGTPASAASDRWAVPRLVCGHHWTSSDELAALVDACRAP